MDDANAPSGSEGSKPGWQQNLKVLGCTFAYMIPLLYLWHEDNYPDDLGIHISARGKAGWTESWWYSYLLIERHHPLDIILFIYMWIPLLGLIAWLSRTWLRDKSGRKISLFDD